MAEILSKGELFAPEIVSGLFTKVKGHSALATLCGQTPISFNGNEIFTFSMDDEVALLGENEQKERGSATVASIKIVPVKVEYGIRVSDEFVYGSEEKKLDILEAFTDGYAKKVARGLDIMAMHGVNPRTNVASSLIKYYFDQNTTNIVNYAADTCDDNIGDAIELLGDYDTNGLIMSKTMASAMGKLQNELGGKKFPELAWGGQPNAVNGVATRINNTVSFGNSADMAIVGDFANCFKWGYAKDIPLEIIPYGDPDNTGKDLKGHNQVYLRSETYIGWGILDGAAFARVIKP